MDSTAVLDQVQLQFRWDNPKIQKICTNIENLICVLWTQEMKSIMYNSDNGIGEIAHSLYRYVGYTAGLIKHRLTYT